MSPGQDATDCPAGAVPLATSDDWATKVSAAAAGTVFCVASGTHLTASNIVPKSGMQFIAAAKGGAVLDGRNTQQFAFQTLQATPSNVVIRGLVIRNYQTPNQRGVLDARNGAGWIIEDNEIDHNNYTGIQMGPSNIVRRNYIHHNRVLGIGAYAISGSLVENNTLAFNPPVAITEAGSTAEASQIKIVASANVTVRQNTITDGQHKGIWFDFGNRGVKIDTNTVLRHGQAGIWQEQGYDAKIRGNTITACATGGGFDPTWIDGAGVQMTNSPDVEIAYNTISGCVNGIAIMAVDGYTQAGSARNYVANLNVHHNTVTMATGRTGIQRTSGIPDSVFTNWNNHFDANSYNTGTAGRAAFAWLNGNQTFTQWQGYGQDLTGSVSP